MAKILTREAGAIRYLHLNKPEKLNALDEEMLLDLDRAFAVWENDPCAAVVVLASTTPRAFCVGSDIEVLARLDSVSMQAWEMLGNRILDRVEQSPLISIASISGHALGGGCTLALACDFRICSENAGFGQPEIEMGWVPGWGGIARLRRTIGLSRAKQLSMTGRRLSATEAHGIGLVDEVAADAELQAKTEEFATKLAGQSRLALQTIKAIAEEKPGTSRAAHQLDAFANASLLGDERGQRAITRFLERKKA